jgi:hypothetical protein
MDEKQLKTIEDRLDRLEKAVFSAKDSGKSKTTVKSFSGLKGGLLFLVSRDFFKIKRLFGRCHKGIEESRLSL